MNEQEKDSIAVAILALAAFVFAGVIIAFAPLEVILAVGAVVAFLAISWALVQVTS